MWATRSIIIAGLLFSTPAWSVSKSELETRIQQLERKLDSRGLVELSDQVAVLQKEVQQLRGELEVQAHEMDSLKKRQRDLYVDIDRRLHRLETAGVQSSVPAQTGAAVISSGSVKPPVAGIAVTPAASSAPLPASDKSVVKVAPVSTLDPAAERKDYDNALAILNELRYDEAASAFREFLKKYPGSSYADNAQYWLGEVYYVTRDFRAALEEFGKLLERFPDSPKVPGAMLKMGYSHYELKDWKAAADLLGQVVKRFPDSSTARLAQKRLDRMKQEGHIPAK
ncbi:tol-pal system protein YbgF [Thiogranum longum]|uniref:Cell division coordinator CpoB n=1 Tax=Thiogranum longum TaxID=1537524 RepID=A0A4R1H6L7_9GAMM|nr:tol-pal system protein YbgF [Thiogranum longum]TCK17384.1 tol-pal system protein YbgF [Thiogranum longum]